MTKIKMEQTFHRVLNLLKEIMTKKLFRFIKLSKLKLIKKL